MPTYVSRREYARMRNVSEGAVRRALKANRIREAANGMIDVEDADRLWEERTDPTNPRNRITGNPGRNKREDGEPPLPAAFGNGLQPRDEEMSKLFRSYTAAKTKKEIFSARREELLTAQLERSLVDRDIVRAKSYEANRRARDLIMSLPDRMTPVVTPLTESREVHKILREEVVRICAELSSKTMLDAIESAIKKGKT